MDLAKIKSDEQTIRKVKKQADIIPVHQGHEDLVKLCEEYALTKSKLTNLGASLDAIKDKIFDMCGDAKLSIKTEYGQLTVFESTRLVVDQGLVEELKKKGVYHLVAKDGVRTDKFKEYLNRQDEIGKIFSGVDAKYRKTKNLRVVH